MPVEDTDAVKDDSVRVMDADLPGEVANQPHIVVAEHDVHNEPLGKEHREGVEDHGAQRPRCTHDRVLYVPGDHKVTDPRLPSEAKEVFHELTGARGRRKALPRTRFAEPQMEVGGDQSARPVGTPGVKKERRLVEDRSEFRGRHAGPNPGTA